jgi:menaquinone reductase, multiheme cytochrome c subunit
MKFRALGVFLGGVALSVLAGWQAFPRLLYRTEPQPVAFSHKVHAEKAGAACVDCHSIAANGRFSGIPPVTTCAGCHAAPMTQSPDEKALIDRYIAKNREIPWHVYARQPDNVYFSHATHLKLAKLPCRQCHGRHGQSDKLRPYQENRISGYSRDIWGYSISRISFRPQEHPGMKMDDCTSCHRSHGVKTSCVACHR